MSTSINLFNPVATRANHLDSGTITVKLATGDTETTLFFCERLGDEPVNPHTQIIRLVSNILKETGFEYFEFDAAGLIDLDSGDRFYTVESVHPRQSELVNSTSTVNYS